MICARLSLSLAQNHQQSHRNDKKVLHQAYDLSRLNSDLSQMLCVSFAYIFPAIGQIYPKEQCLEVVTKKRIYKRPKPRDNIKTGTRGRKVHEGERERYTNEAPFSLFFRSFFFSRARACLFCAAFSSAQKEATQFFTQTLNTTKKGLTNPQKAKTTENNNKKKDASGGSERQHQQRRIGIIVIISLLFTTTSSTTPAGVETVREILFHSVSCFSGKIRSTFFLRALFLSDVSKKRALVLSFDFSTAAERERERDRCARFARARKKKGKESMC
jgi:hypothetical protein